MDRDHTSHNRRAALIEERIHLQRAANAALKDGRIDEAVQCQKRVLELNIQIDTLTLNVFRENTGEAPPSIIQPVAIAS